VEPVAVIDFETTGMSPMSGARATEIAVVLLEGGRIRARYHSLMNAGVPVPPFIQALTGISTAIAEVMAAAADFIGDHPLVAHNATFDRRFLDAELERIGRARQADFACTLLAARRIYPEAPNHKLGTLIQFTGLPAPASYHRALTDAEMAAGLLAQMERDLQRRFGLKSVSHARLRELQGVPRRGLNHWLQNQPWATN
jgi:DNA polymerase-3 subunit epsilon